MWSRRSISANAAASARAASLSEATANFNSSEVPSTFSNCETRHAGRAVDGRPPPTVVSSKTARAIENFIRCLFIDDAVKSNQEPLAVKSKMQKIDCFFKSLLLPEYQSLRLNPRIQGLNLFLDGRSAMIYCHVSK